jgi:hypothetical protein
MFDRQRPIADTGEMPLTALVETSPFLYGTPASLNYALSKLNDDPV